MQYDKIIRMNNEKPLSREELRKLRPSVRNFYILQREHPTRTQKLATWITEKVGTMGFFYILVIWTVLWLGWNIYAPAELRFDPFPAFVMWLFISNLLQLVLTPLIMVGQNIQAYHADARAQADFELNQIAEKEIDTILIHLENQNEIMLNILQKLEQKEDKKKIKSKTISK